VTAISDSAKTYDTIIVGAGSAGCVLAGRLSADGTRRVLVLEAGDRDRHWLLHVPIGVGKVWQDPRFNWSYMSEPEPNLGGRRIFHPRGKVVGGTSSINMMAYVRGNRGDYDRWRQKGLDGWSYADVLPYFKRAETFTEAETEFHGTDGPWNIQTTTIDDPIIETFFEAARGAGYKMAEDYNGAVQEGFARLQINVHQGRRRSSAVAYLHPALSRPNLTLEVRAYVTRVLFDGARAVGVEYVQGGRTHRAEAEREVILSGGALNSPHVLMLSGVGPADHLAETGIAPVHDLAGVGANLQDHPAVGIEYRYAGRSHYHDNLRLDRLAVNMARARLFGTGPATMPPSSVTGFIRTAPELEIPDIQMFFRPASASARQWLPVIMPGAEETFAFRACLLRPESRGTLRLGSTDPHAPIRIRNDFLATETDRRVLRKSFRVMRALASQPAFDGIRGPELAPGAEVDDDDAIDAYIRETATTFFHPAGTCRMGADGEAVVDGDLRVRGLDGLRVVDASVMPDLVGGNINAAVIMIAEKAADAILGRASPPASEV
jgi:choline dehydrogenase-like flavoprotein